ncbi:MAG TPA: site-specific integrase [Streptosporangiaceae bacterium]|nr:site-specific integrase [Streptosporangiaceae bacterium]
MGTVHPLGGRQAAGLGEAVAAYLAALDHPESAGTRRVYGSTLRALAAEYGARTGISDLDAAALSAWFSRTWGGRAPATWNRNRDALRGLLAFAEAQGWLTDADALTRGIRRRKRAPDNSRALPRADVDQLLGREDIAIRERVLWRLLYETAARSAEVLRLDVGDLDMPNRKAKVRRKGGAIDTIVWQTGTARLLPRLLKGRKSGPLFLTDRRARVELPPCDVDRASGRARLSYRQAEALFKAASGGATLHQLRHSALTHAAEDGASTPMLLARSGHTSVASLARYARVSAEALARWQEEHDPARRR